MRGERWRGEESALEVLKPDFFYSFLKKERSIGRRDGRCSEEEEDTGANLLKQGKGMSESDESRWSRDNVFFPLQPARRSLKRFRLQDHYIMPGAKQ